MKTGLCLGLKQTQKLVMTQSLRQSIEILQLSNIELAEMLAKEFLDNPVLEEVPAPVVENSLQEDVSRTLSNDEKTYYEGFSQIGVRAGDDKQRHYIENAIAVKESLTDHLLWQAKMTAPAMADYSVYEEIITSLTSEGFLNPDLIDRINLENKKIKSIVKNIQAFDPVGCASSGIRESLLIQAHYYYPEDEILHRMIEFNFDELEKLDYTAISRNLNINLADVIEKSRLLQNLNPFPGFGFFTGKVKYLVPDLDVRIFNEEIVVTLNDDWISGVRISSYYENLLKQKKTDIEQQSYLSEKINNARSLIKNISTRRETIYNVVKSIMVYQEDFLKKGPGHLRYLTHHDVAADVGVHESTVSRVASNKAVQTQWGVFELKYFFVSKLKSQSNEEKEEQSSDRAKSLMQLIIGSENPEKPYSDEDIAAHMKESGIVVARRTVAKYRESLNIPSSNKRKKINMIKQQEIL